MSKQKKTAEEFDREFDEGRDIGDDLDVESAVRRVNVDFPLWMLKLLDVEAKRLGVPRQAIIKTWINDRIETNKRNERRKVI
jgi:hypothetical protein